MKRKIKQRILSLKDLWKTFEHYKSRSVLLLFMLVFGSFLDAFSMGMLLPVMEIIVKGSSESTFGGFVVFVFQGYGPEKTLIYILTVFFLLVLLKNVIIYLKNRVYADLCYGLRGYWMQKMMTKYLKSDYDFIVNCRQGTLINNILVEAEKAQACL